MYQFHDLLLIKQIAQTDLKLRYNSSFLGFFWSLLHPFMLLSVLYVVFSHFFQSQQPYFPIFLLTGIIIWNFFAECSVKTMTLFMEKSSLVQFIRFRKSILVVASCLTTFMTLLLNLTVLFFFMFLSRVSFSFVFFAAWFPLLNLYLLTVGISFALCVLYLSYRDLIHIWPALLQIGFFCTPIFYPAAIAPDVLKPFFELNPLARILNELRLIFLSQSFPSWSEQGLTCLLCSLFLFAGYRLFKRYEPWIAEIL